MWNDSFELARTLALASHAGQLYGDVAYSKHLESVIAVLERFGARLDDDWTAPILVAGWLHDAVEDTPLELDTVRTQLGDTVADLVWRVTDESGANRRERKAATYGKISADERAVILKLADRIANVEHSRHGKTGLLRMYAKEQAGFADALRPVCQTEMANAMWDHLDRCFVEARPPN